MGPPRAHRAISTAPRRPGLTPPSYSQPWKGAAGALEPSRGQGQAAGHQRGGTRPYSPPGRRRATSASRCSSPGDTCREAVPGTPRLRTTGMGWGRGLPPPSPLIPALGTARAHRLGAFTRAPPWPAVMGSNPAEKKRKKNSKRNRSRVWHSRGAPQPRLLQQGSFGVISQTLKFPL